MIGFADIEPVRGSLLRLFETSAKRLRRGHLDSNLWTRDVFISHHPPTSCVPSLPLCFRLRQLQPHREVLGRSPPPIRAIQCLGTCLNEVRVVAGISQLLVQRLQGRCRTRSFEAVACIPYSDCAINGGGGDSNPALVPCDILDRSCVFT